MVSLEPVHRFVEVISAVEQLRNLGYTVSLAPTAA